ncbi:FG-GAP repeat domain-containing protein [Fervidobacterium sp.]
MRNFVVNHCLLIFLLLFVLKVYAANSTSIDWNKPDFVSSTFPISNYDQSKPESAFGAVYARNISVRVIGTNVVAVNAYKIQTVQADPGAGPFKDVSQTHAVDFDRNGYSDIIAVTYGGTLVVKRNVMPNIGILDFQDVTSYVIGNSSYSYIAGDGTMVVDDFNNDGKLDLFLYNAKYQAAFINDVVTPKPTIQDKHKNIAITKIDKDSKFLTNWTVSAMASYDFDKDGYKDIIYADMSGRVWFWKNDPTRGNSRFFDASKITLLFSDPDIGTTASNGGAVLDIGDLNGDGVPDIVAGNTDKRGIFIYYGELVNNEIKYTPEKKVAIVKLDGDLGTEASVDGTIPNSKSPKYLPSFAPTIIKITDLDRDGKPDIFVGTDAWRQGANFGGSIYLFKGTSRDTTGKPKFTSLELVKGSYSSENKPPYDFDAGAIGDLDNDGIPDFVAADGNHSGNFYKVITKTVQQYVTEPGILLSDYLTNLVNFKLPDGTMTRGIPRSVLQNYFVYAIEVEVSFTNDGSGKFEIRYSKSAIKDPTIIDPKNFPLMLDPNKIDPSTNQWLPMDPKPVPFNGSFKARVILSTPSPDPQILIVLYPDNQNTAPHLKSVVYRIWTKPATVEIKGFRWLKSAW